jgi:hypothetical protein
MSAPQPQDRKKTIVYAVFGVVLLAFVIFAYNAFFAGPGPAPVTPAAVVVTRSGSEEGTGTRSSAGGAGAQTTAAQTAGAQGVGLGAIPGVAAKKMASTSSSLDPTLDETAMLRTESLVYSGSGRNIFSLTYVPPPVELPKAVPAARPPAPVYVAPVATGPPPPPPINLKFFGTETRANGMRQAFLLSGEDVYLASQGDIVAHKYKIVSIAASSVQVEDLTNSNTQTLPLQTN